MALAAIAIAKKRFAPSFKHCMEINKSLINDARPVFPTKTQCRNIYSMLFCAPTSYTLGRIDLEVASKFIFPCAGGFTNFLKNVKFKTKSFLTKKIVKSQVDKNPNATSH